MSERDKEILSKLAAACEVLPDGKREFLIGYAGRRSGNEEKGTGGEAQ